MKLIFIFAFNFLSPTLQEFKSPPDNKCIDKMVDKIFDTVINTNCYLVLPTETDKFENGKLFIQKESFQNYMVTMFSAKYQNIDTIKQFVKNVLLQKEKLIFSEMIYREFIKKEDFYVRDANEELNLKSKVKQEKFLQKYLCDYNSDQTAYNITRCLPNPTRNFLLIVDGFFRLNYLVNDVHDQIAVYKVHCE